MPKDNGGCWCFAITTLTLNAVSMTTGLPIVKCWAVQQKAFKRVSLLHGIHRQKYQADVAAAATIFTTTQGCGREQWAGWAKPQCRLV